MTLSITKALDTIYQNTNSVSTQIIPLENALGLVLAKDYIASFNLPRFDNSAMDGYAIHCTKDNQTLVCTGVIYAGDNPTMTLEENEAIKIMTGAPIPKGTQAIVPIEEVEVDENKITICTHIKENAHIRYAGEDIKKGEVYLEKGQKICPYALSLFASQGVSHLSVYRKIKVAVFASGDELKPHFETIEAHQLYNSNTPMFIARAKELGCEVDYINVAKDTLEDLQLAIKEALYSDIILTSGGMSQGDKDFTKQAFKNLGASFYFEKVDIKPGKPTAFGKINDTIILSLAGNPLASMVNYEIFVRAILYKLSGQKAFYHDYIETIIDRDYTFRGGKEIVHLGTFDGKVFSPIAKQQAGMLSPLPLSDGFIMTKKERSFIPKGSKVKMIGIRNPLYSKKWVDLFC